MNPVLIAADLIAVTVGYVTIGLFFVRSVTEWYDYKHSVSIEPLRLTTLVESEISFLRALEKAQIRHNCIQSFIAEHECGPENDWDDTWKTLFAIQYPEASS